MADVKIGPGEVVDGRKVNLARLNLRLQAMGNAWADWTEVQIGDETQRAVLEETAKRLQGAGYKTRILDTTKLVTVTPR